MCPAHAGCVQTGVREHKLAGGADSADAASHHGMGCPHLFTQLRAEADMQYGTVTAYWNCVYARVGWAGPLVLQWWRAFFWRSLGCIWGTVLASVCIGAGRILWFGDLCNSHTSHEHPEFWMVFGIVACSICVGGGVEIHRPLMDLSEKTLAALWGTVYCQ